MKRLLAIGLLVLAGCGEEERQPASEASGGMLEVRMELADGPLYTEGSVPVIDVRTRDGEPVLHAEPKVGSLDRPVLREFVPWGSLYRFEAVQRPCSGNCDHLDPPDEASRCTTRFGMADGPTVIVIRLRGARDGVAATCAVRK